MEIHPGWIHTWVSSSSEMITRQCEVCRAVFKMSCLDRKVILLFLALLVLTTSAKAKVCKNIKFIGHPIADLGETYNTHGTHLVIFSEQGYAIDVDGYLIGWTIFQSHWGKAVPYLDLWRRKDGFWVIVNKTKLVTNGKGNYSVGFQEEIKVG